MGPGYDWRSGCPETPAYTLGESDALGDILSWTHSPKQDGRATIESGLLDLFEVRARDARHIPALARPMFASMGEETKRRLVHHPYLAGYLRGDFEMSPEQFCYFVASTLASTRNNAAASRSPADEPYGTDRSGPEATGNRRFQCVFDDSDQLPLYEGGERFTDALTSDEAMVAMNRVVAAFASIARLSPPAAEFVNTYLWALALRAHPGGSDKLGSRSYQCLPGLALFCNPHSGKATRFDAEEALIHETIHSFLFFCETASCRLLQHPRFEGEKIRSPWTSSVLDFHTGVHALIVWLALLFYWSDPAQTRHSPERLQHAVRRSTFAQRGLNCTEAEAFLANINGKVSTPIQHLIGDLIARAARI